jgi:[acyl-carrier-protein] S-malonyltransferase
MALAKDAGAKRALRLNVSGAFHSPLMRVAEAGLRSQLDAVDLDAPAFPVVSNVTAQPVTDPADARRLLVEQLTSPVRWTESVRSMAARGVTNLVEVGPGSVLSGLVKRIEKGLSTRTVGTAAELEALA